MPLRGPIICKHLSGSPVTHKPAVKLARALNLSHPIVMTQANIQCLTEGTNTCFLMTNIYKKVVKQRSVAQGLP